ncbi:MAG: hydrogenase assembly protein HupF [Candidatus Zixiibacteriota bacterium]|nr:MAG: hydrogenase assembly protein HupF [candidate division Zixibacteria bacterium]
MCLAVPGRVVEFTDNGPLTRAGRVSFGGIVRDVNLSTVPVAEVGDYVLVHAGFAISIIDPDEAARTIEYLCQIESPTNGQSGGR